MRSHYSLKWPSAVCHLWERGVNNPPPSDRSFLEHGYFLTKHHVAWDEMFVVVGYGRQNGGDGKQDGVIKI